MSSQPTEISNAYAPIVDHYQFRKIVRRMGNTNIIHRKLSTDHCTCFDPISHSADPNCPICHGLGYPFTEHYIEGIFREHPPHGMYGTGSVITVAGEVHRRDAMLFCDPRYDKIIEMGDLIIFYDTEYRVMNKVRRFGTKRRMVYVVYELFKTTRPLST